MAESEEEDSDFRTVLERYIGLRKKVEEESASSISSRSLSKAGFLFIIFLTAFKPLKS